LALAPPPPFHVPPAAAQQHPLEEGEDEVLEGEEVVEEMEGIETTMDLDQDEDDNVLVYPLPIDGEEGGGKGEVIVNGPPASSHSQAKSLPQQQLPMTTMVHRIF
jgi:hypothetical protein